MVLPVMISGMASGFGASTIRALQPARATRGLIDLLVMWMMNHAGKHHEGGLISTVAANLAGGPVCIPIAPTRPV